MQSWEEFLTVLVIVFSLVMIVAGLFTAYFGSGKSRKIGVALFIIGLVLLIVWAYLVGVFGEPALSIMADVSAWDVVKEALFNIVAALIGALAAVGIFLVAVMKS
ncbi:MAG: hypothetical protein LBV13_00650 [Methanomassiliicoccaceae archaeon]|jgi:hypothetical protein|nr:hypothetical protein [Methanomassiliicoccaceae archaeon]